MVKCCAMDLEGLEALNLIPCDQSLYRRRGLLGKDRPIDENDKGEDLKWIEQYEPSLVYERYPSGARGAQIS